jgi:hypothetical protein
MSEIPSHIGACEFGMLRQSLCAARDSLTRSCVMPMGGRLTSLAD